jgi:hypothetical protein
MEKSVRGNDILRERLRRFARRTLPKVRAGEFGEVVCGWLRGRKNGPDEQADDKKKSFLQVRLPIDPR